MFADKFNSNNRTYPSRERCPRRSVVLKYVLSDSHKGCPYGIVFQFVADDAHIVRIHFYSPAENWFDGDAEPYDFCR